MPNQTPLPGHCNHPLSDERDPRSSSGGLCSHLVTYGVRCAAGHDATYHIAPADTGSAPPSTALVDSAPALDTPVSPAEAALDAFVGELPRLGVTGDTGISDEAFALDFANGVVGAPHLEGTGWFPTRSVAETAAALLLPRLNAIALAQLAENPEHCDTSWTDSEEEARQSYAYLQSRVDENGIPTLESSNDSAVYDEYLGDEWLVASVELGMLSPDQQQRLDDLRAFLRSVDQEETFARLAGIRLPAAA